MAVKRLLLTLFVVLAGLSIAVRASADYGYFDHDHDNGLKQYLVACDVNAQGVAANTIALASCSAPPGAYSYPSGPIPVTRRGGILVEFIGADASTSVPGALVQSIEVTLNFLDSDSNLVDFMDVAFSPYINAPGGGKPPANITYGATSRPNIFLRGDTILNDPVAQTYGETIAQAQLELQVFVNNTTGSLAVANATLRALVDY
jgi:hypothetical protein